MKIVAKSIELLSTATMSRNIFDDSRLHMKGIQFIAVYIFQSMQKRHVLK